MLPDDVLARHPEWASLPSTSAITPPVAPSPPMPMTHFDQGGTVNIGQLDPNDPNTVNAVLNGQITYNPAQNGVNNVSIPGDFPIPSGANNPVGSAGQTYAGPAQSSPYVLPGSQSGPIAAQWQATNQLNAATGQYINAQQNALNFQPQVRAADAAVYNAQDAQNQANRAYLAEQLRASQLSQQEQQKIQAAKQNTSDIIAVGQEQNLRNNSDFLYSLAGLKAPVDLNLPADFKGPLPPGTRAKLQTLSDWLTEKANDADTMEKFNVEAARIHAANTGEDVSAAQVAAGRVRLKLDELDAAAKAAGLGVQAANLAQNTAQQSPAPGLVWNQVQNAWTSKEQNDYDTKQYLNDFDQAQNTPLGSIPAGTLNSMYINDVITADQYQQGLIDQGVPAATAAYYVANAEAEKQKAKNGAAAQIAAILGINP